MPPKRNLLFIFTDQQRRETLGCYPGTPPQVRTPNLDRLAETSAVFDRAYCTQPTCTPSRSSLLTGLYPHATGCIENNMALPAEMPTLAEMVSPEYKRAYMGKWHLGYETEAQHGFETWLSTEDNYVAHKGNATGEVRVSDYTRYLLERGIAPDEMREGVAMFSRRQTAKLPEADFRTTYLGREAARFVREVGDEPFILYVAFQEPHPPYLGPLDDLYPPGELPTSPIFRQPPPEGAPRVVQQLAEVFQQPATLYGQDMTTEAGWRKTAAKYYGNCTLVDRAVGLVLDALEASGHADDTLVVYTTDHGDMLGEHGLWGKAVLYEPSAGVPLIVRAPWLGREHRRLPEPISQIDLVPTLLDLLEQPIPAGLHGRSRAGRVAGQARPAGEDAVVEWNGGSGHQKHKSWKYTQPHPEVDWSQVQGPRRSLIAPDGYKLNLSASDTNELYDLNADPHETRNLFAAPEQQSRIAAMTSRLQAWQTRVNDTAVLPISNLQSPLLPSATAPQPNSHAPAP
jgi:arylsulfatase A-like enzyme